MASIVPTKLRPPSPRAQDIPRPALARWLDQLTGAQGRDSGLVAIRACPGTGKTTLLGAWAASRRVGWVSLDETDNNPALFQQYAEAALANAPSDAPLILDNYHLITAPAVHELVASLVNSSRRVVIATRGGLPTGLNILCAHELRTADLAFTQNEAAVFLDRAVGGQLTIAQVETLYARTEGWITGLRLAALHAREYGTQRDALAAFVAMFGGSLRYVADYLGEEAFEKLSDELQQFVLQTSILGEPLNGPTCDAVTGRGDSAALLFRLEMENRFTFALGGGAYRYHTLFADYLRERAARLASGIFRATHRRAAAWHIRQGSEWRAIDHLLAAGDHGRAAPLIERIARRLVADGSVNILLHWLDALPEATISHYPALCLYHAYALVNTHRLDQLATISARLDAARLTLGSALHNQPGYAGLVEGVEAVLAHVRGEPALAGTRALRARNSPAASHNPALREALTLQYGVDCWTAGEVDTTAGELDGVAASADPRRAALAACQGGYLNAGRGRLNAASQRFHAALAVLEAHGASRDRVAALAHAGLSDIQRERGELQVALACERIGLQLGDGETAFWGYAAQMRAYLSARDLSRAAEALRRAEARASSGTLRMYAAACRARLHMLRGKPGDAAAVGTWLRESRLSANSVAMHISGGHPAFEILTFVRALIVSQRYSEALESLAAYKEWARHAGRDGDLIERAALEALAQRGRGSIGSALEVLGGALRAGEAEGYARVFLDEGEPMIDLLARYRKVRRDAATYIARLLTGVRIRETPGAADTLTGREHEILRLLAAGQSYREIAAELGVAVSTVKTHILSIYSKLGVESRTRAIRRAEELGLI